MHLSLSRHIDESKLRAENDALKHKLPKNELNFGACLDKISFVVLMGPFYILLTHFSVNSIV